MATVLILKDGTEIKIDVTSKRSKNISSQVTDHPIEDSSDLNITDHVIVNQDTFSISGMLSEVRKPNDTRVYNYLIIDDILEKTCKSSDLVKLQSDLDLRTNLKLLSYSTTQSTETGKSLSITLDFKTVNFVKTKSVKIPKRLIGKGKPNQTTPQKKQQIQKDKDKFSPAVDKGKAKTNPANPKQAENIKEKKKSLLASLADATGKAVKGVLP
jgi:hypothetical protein